MLRIQKGVSPPAKFSINFFMFSFGESSYVPGKITAPSIETFFLLFELKFHRLDGCKDFVNSLRFVFGFYGDKSLRRIIIDWCILKNI